LLDDTLVVCAGEFGRTVFSQGKLIDHMKLTFQYQGRHFRLTDVFGNVVKAALA
jgi:hypothetical protein